MNAALAAQQERRLEMAARLYLEVLARVPDQPDALHMLGVIRFEEDKPREALSLILRALELTQWQYPSYRHNLGLALASANRHANDELIVRARARYRQRSTQSHSSAAMTPRISVVVPCHDHAEFIESALRSVYAQSYRNLELIVIDDGSADDSAARAQRVLLESPFPYRLIVRENRGAASTINEGVALSTGDYINVLNSDDLFFPDRLQTMADAVVAVGAHWGFSAVSLIDAQGEPIDTLRNARAYAISCAVWSVPYRETVGFALLSNNAAVSTGNLFAARTFIDDVGGFRDLRYNHDWDFCLRALRLDEPVFVARETYGYRLHGSNTIDESERRARSEANQVLEEYCAWAFNTTDGGSQVAPSVGNWGTTFTTTLLESGMAEVIGLSHLRRLANETLAGMVADARDESTPT